MKDKQHVTLTKQSKLNSYPAKALKETKTQTTASMPLRHKGDIMAAISSGDATSIMKVDLQDLFEAFESRIYEKLTEHLAGALQQIECHLEEIQTSMQQIAQMANEAMEASIANREGIRSLEQYETYLREKLLTLDNAVCQNQLKIRGIPEGEKGTSDILTFISEWLTSILGWDSSTALQLQHAYRLEAPPTPYLTVGVPGIF